MLVTLLVMLRQRDDIETAIRNFYQSIQVLNYPKDKFEIVFIWVCSNKDGYKKIAETPTMVRLFYADTWTNGLNLGFRKAHGQIVVVTDVDVKPGESMLGDIAQAFQESNGRLGMLVEDKYWVAWKSLERFPDDTLCAPSFAVLSNLSAGFKVVGTWPTMHRREILRFAYKIYALKDWRLKAKIFLAYAKGDK